MATVSTTSSDKAGAAKAPAQSESPAAAEPAKSKTLADRFNAVPSFGALQHAVTLEAAVPDADRVAMVSRDVNGDAMQSTGYAVLIGDDAAQVEKDAAHNLAGQAQGAANLKAD